MPSKRPSTPAMDEAAAAAERLRASASRSKKRSSRSKSRARDRRRGASPNPNPSPHRDRQPRGRDRDREREGERGAAAGSAPSRKSDRKRRPRSFPDSATLAAAMASAASASRGGGGGGSGAAQKLWSDADEVALLRGAIAFKERTGVAPRLPDMVDLFESLRGSVAPHLDQAKVYYKLKRLKSKFQHSAPGATSSRHELRVRDLSADLWGAELAAPIENNADAVEEEAVEEGDAGERYTGGDADVAARMPIVSEVLGDYWRLNGRALSGVSLEKGLAQLGSEEAGLAEAKWRRQLEAEIRTQMRRQDLGKEVFGLLIDAVKGLGP